MAGINPTRFIMRFKPDSTVTQISSICDDSNWDDNGHGTHVAGIAAGSIHGVAKKAIVHAVKVLDAQGSGSYSNIISGMGWVKNFVLQNNIRQAVVVISNWDDNGHGTHVAGIAAGSIHGVAKKAIVHAVKVLDAQGSGSYSNIISGMGWVKNFVLQNNIRQAVVVMSLGGPRASSLNDAVEDLATEAAAAAGPGVGDLAAACSLGLVGAVGACVEQLLGST
ncbi:Kazal-like domain-containing protein [Haematococcus lacustris]|uniref:Kazal-like domain-containing protein n=1 Tax=Haematococcus lacustris TaxID=44745 RepID=A0A699YT14_HAELA|nr:Kazal-like domain-containing protein [Haematococcus lacustris]